MSGIYIHIPFCRQKCYYCDFYKTVKTSYIPQFLSVLKEEAKLRKKYLGNKAVKTIYLGGGTPSVLTTNDIKNILILLSKEYHLESDAEITMECNPEDLDSEYLNNLKNTGVNRLSIGIQSFQDTHLRKMNRRHSAKPYRSKSDRAGPVCRQTPPPGSPVV